MKMSILREDAVLDLIENHPVVFMFGHGTAIITDLPKSLTTDQLHQLIDLSFTTEEKESILQFCRNYSENLTNINDARIISVLDSEAAQTFVKECRQFDTHPVEDYIMTWKQFVAYINEQIFGGDFAP